MKNNWKNLQDLLFFQEGPGVRKNQFRNNGVKLLNVGNINDKKLNLDTTSIFISEEEAYGKYSHFLVENGDLLICCSGIVVDNFHNKIVFAEEKHLPLCLNTSTMRFRTLNDDILNIKYFYYFLMTKLFKEQLQKLITGSAQLNFGPSHIKKIFMPIVELNKQKQIAKTLDKAQELIDLRKESIAKLDELAKSIFIDMFEDYLIDENPTNMLNFEEFAIIDTNMTTNFEEFAELPHIGIASIERDTGNILNFKLVKEENLESGKYLFNEKHILYSKIRPNLNKVALPSFSGLLSADAYPILAKDNVNRIFLAFLLRSNYFLNYILSHSDRANIPKVNKKQLSGFYCNIPDLGLQNKFAKIIEKIEEQKSLYEKVLEKLEENFQALLQQSFKE